MSLQTNMKDMADQVRLKTQEVKAIISSTLKARAKLKFNHLVTGRTTILKPIQAPQRTSPSQGVSETITEAGKVAHITKDLTQGLLIRIKFIKEIRGNKFNKRFRILYESSRRIKGNKASPTSSIASAKETGASLITATLTTGPRPNCYRKGAQPPRRPGHLLANPQIRAQLATQIAHNKCEVDL